jgi:hypothetical protein
MDMLANPKENEMGEGNLKGERKGSRTKVSADLEGHPDQEG